jgi:hypothetical protein
LRLRDLTNQTGAARLPRRILWLPEGATDIQLSNNKSPELLAGDGLSLIVHDGIAILDLLAGKLFVCIKTIS